MDDATTEEAEPPKWHPELIKAQIRMRGQTLTALAIKNGLHESACRAALKRSQPEAERVISHYLNVPLHDLWPDRYDANGDRIRHVRDDNNHEHSESHRLSRGAA